jgi:hypothetical protein
VIAVRTRLFVLLLAGCTQDFGAFEFAGDGSEQASGPLPSRTGGAHDGAMGGRGSEGHAGDAGTSGEDLDADSAPLDGTNGSSMMTDRDGAPDTSLDPAEGGAAGAAGAEGGDAGHGEDSEAGAGGGGGSSGEADAGGGDAGAGEPVDAELCHDAWADAEVGSTTCADCACEACAEPVWSCLTTGSTNAQALCHAVLACAIAQGCRDWDCYCASPQCGSPSASGDGPCAAEMNAAAFGTRDEVSSIISSHNPAEPLVRAHDAIRCVIGIARRSTGGPLAGACEGQCR